MIKANRFKLNIVTFIVLLTSMFLAVMASGQTSSGVDFKYMDQGPKWTSNDRLDFYSRDQGSRMIPYKWMKALKQKNGKPFMGASLERYGYLPNNSTPGVPVGFTIAEENGEPSLGMTCSACHTRQIEVNGEAYRIDGGPSIVDFQSFLSDLDDAVGMVKSLESKAFDEFSHAVLGTSYTKSSKKALHAEVKYWYTRFHIVISKSLPPQSWGPSRLDAVSMIFNRLTGLDIGAPPNYIIEENIKVADAPVRYPFLWNAPIQDLTQWPGFAPNGNALFGLTRNLGEVYGVFATFHPKESFIWGIDYLARNSADFDGLMKLEKLIEDLGAPQWEWGIDDALSTKGKEIFNRETKQGGCQECHGKRKGEFRSFEHSTWATPVVNVGTDTKEYEVLERTVKTGVLKGASDILGLTEPLKSVEPAITVLTLTVVNSIVQQVLRSHMSMREFQATLKKGLSIENLPPELQALEEVFKETGKLPLGKKSTGGAKYEARVLEGIWAAAPYLHNGSVPTLNELLKPASERVREFKIGPAYDILNVGLAVEQTKFDYTLKTTGCSELNSGNSNCGHEYGTTLSENEKKALLEYLKLL